MWIAEYIENMGMSTGLIVIDLLESYTSLVVHFRNIETNELLEYSDKDIMTFLKNNQVMGYAKGSLNKVTKQEYDIMSCMVFKYFDIVKTKWDDDDSFEGDFIKDLDTWINGIDTETGMADNVVYYNIAKYMRTCKCFTIDGNNLNVYYWNFYDEVIALRYELNNVAKFLKLLTLED